MTCTREYFLQTKRLGFSRWSEDDFPLAVGLWGDPEVTRLIGGPFLERQVVERLHQEISIMTEHNVQYWPVFLRSDAEFAGCAGLRPYKPEERIYELGIHLRAIFWGRGLAQEAGRAVIELAFGNLGAKALFAGHHPDNAASRKVLERLGFRYTHNELYPPTGKRHPPYLLEHF